MTNDDIFEKHYLEIVSDPRFKLFGLTRADILAVRERMDMHAVDHVSEVLKPAP